MKIQCENCATQHELDPPAWVVSSGRAFRFRCSSCGHSQSVQPTFSGSQVDEGDDPTTEPPPADEVVSGDVVATTPLSAALAAMAVSALF